MTTRGGAQRRQVFRDVSGRRWRRVRRAAMVAGIVTSVLAFALVIAILAPPLLPVVVGGEGRSADLVHLPRIATTRRDRERIAARRRLFVQRAGRRGPAAVRAGSLPLGRGRPPAPQGDTTPIVAGFYVNWDDNSFASLSAHVADLDWVVCEWAFVAPGGDSLRLRVDRKVLYLAARQPTASRPSILTMVTNYDSAGRDFDGARLRRLVGSARSRARVIAQLDTMVASYGLAGVTIDFEEIPAGLEAAVARFVRDVGVAMHRRGAIVTQALAVGGSTAELRRYASVNDRVFLMLYDEHYGTGDPGPVASQGWYERQAERALAVIPPRKAILAIGAYGYDWSDAVPAAAGDERTFQDVMRDARSHSATVHFDSASMNPWIGFTDPDSTDHVVWFLDGATASNQAAIGRALGAGGRAIWRLGAEDPSLWRAIGARGGSAAALESVPAAYDVEFDGAGEILTLKDSPAAGRRSLVTTPDGLITSERYTSYPTPYVIGRTGDQPHRVALTFDDGPDPQWTPLLLDTLKKYHAPATFFVIGQNAEAHIPLMRRIIREGHEFGNHTFTHPNLALTSAFVTRLELDATERLLEAVLARRSALFRPPYFGDAEPTTADELDPIGVASGLGYVAVGLHVDSEDWLHPGAPAIVRNVLDGRTRAQHCLDSLHTQRPTGSPLENGCSGSIVLLHDGGGDRSQTVAALGPVIDSLRARGDTLVLVSDLAGLTREEAMPPLPRSGAAIRLAELATFGAIGAIEWLLHWLFLLAVILGVGRLAVMTVLALIQHLRARRARDVDAEFGPVAVIVPAYNEEKVIARTVATLLEQDYPGDLRIIVVDDGSPDGTLGVLRAIYGSDPRVAIHSKPNGGKASALNYGIALTAAPIIVALDADTLFETDTITRLVAPLADPAVGAVAGNAKVGNRVNLVTRWQAVEYVTSQNLDRRAFSLLDCITVVPGAVGAWRRELTVAAGGFSEDTLAEDQDLTLAIRRQGYSVAYAADAVAYTEAPETLAGLAKQRFRWSFGTLQCMWKHRDALFSTRYGTLGWIAMPNVWLFQLLFAALSPLADLLFLWSLFSVWLVREEHGATYALTNLEQVLTLYAIFLLVDWLAAAIAFLAEPEEDKRLTWLVFLQRFAYRQVMYWVVLRSFVAAVRGHVVGWGKLERSASVELPA